MRKKVKKLADGGPFQWGEREDGLEVGAAISAGSNLAGGLLDAIAPGDEYGVRSSEAALGSGALKGAAAGAALGPIGAAVGGVAGLVGGLFGNKKARKLRKEATADKMTAMDKQNRLLSQSIMQTDPTTVAGRKDAQMYRYGGTLKGSPSTSFKMPSALAAVPKVDILPTVAISPRKMMSNGGSLKGLHSGAVEVKGPSHAKGGVKIPELGVELEGKETIADGFVFSDKLGFAKQHKPIALAIGKTERMPESPSTRRTLQALTKQEDRLKMKQEQTKQQLGIPTSLTKMENGGELDRRKAIATRLKQIKSENRGILFDDSYKGKPTKAHAEYKALLAENKAIIEGKSPATQAGRNQGFINALASSKTNIKAPLPITRVRNGKTTVTPTGATAKPAVKSKLSQTTIDKTGYTGQTAASRRKAASTPKSLINDPQLVDPKAIIAAENRKNAWIKEGLSPKSNIGSTITRPDGLGPVLTQPKDVENAGVDNKINKAVDAITPFTSNIANMFRRLPKPPTPSAQSALTPSLLDLSADRAEAVRQRRGADAAADAGLNGGNATSASRAANLSQQIRATSAINQSENNANSQIKNQFQMLNSQIAAGNEAKQDQYNTQLVERQLKQQELNAENLADIGNKSQVLSRDNKLFDLENDKLMLEVGKDPTGASFRATEAILKKRMTPRAFASLQASNLLKEQNVLEENKALRQTKAGNPAVPKALAK